MSNVHGFRDVERGQNRGGGGNGGNARPGGSLPLFTSNLNPAGDPRQESFGDMIKYVCCPSLTIYSFMFAITVIDIVIFLAELFYGGVNTQGAFLEAKVSTLDAFGAKNPYKIRYDYQVWRFLLPIFLHANFSHIFYNCVSQLIFGVPLESKCGIRTIILIYFISGIGGNIFSCLLTDGLSVGASTAVFGLLGSQLAFIIVNWKALDYPGSGRDKYLLITILLILFNFLFGSQNDNVDNWGHVGGLIVGIFIGLALIDVGPVENRNEAYERTIKRIGFITVGVFYALGLIIFFAARNPYPVIRL
eukprot:TRINITY_DN520_c0_g1_i14.p1 TRINITY_DN520_c0_g1~~TRINITY_DN520_c0_g1_i14.p1  ORF type:complete len:304 (-),score=48.91 TRINITY_DN520_c0_g1_i14:598-1509(-)